MSSAAPTLPAEIIKHILELAVEGAATWDNGDAQANPRSGYDLLRKAARVSKAWSVPACEALWQRVELRTGAQAFEFASSAGNRRYRTKEVLVDCPVGPSLMKMLAELEGVKSLEIGPRVKGISSDFMYLPSLKDLSSLKIRCMVVESYRRSSSPEIKPIPLQLKHLTISGEFSSRRTAAAILLGVQHSLISLDLQNLSKKFPVPTTAFPPLPNLTTLKFNDHASSFAQNLLPHNSNLRQSFLFDQSEVAEFQALFSNSVKTSLHSLELSNSHLVSPYSWRGEEYDAAARIRHYDAVEWALHEFEVLRELRVLRVGWTRTSLGKSHSGATLLRTIDLRGIKLEGLSAQPVNIL
ncbi:hypothetical protein P7C70_g7955, partial [Phenoliferia sp. Uapishka_3]